MLFLYPSGYKVQMKLTADTMRGLEVTYLGFLRVLFKKRVAATHMLVVMVSAEGHNVKPYATPVQHIPYVSLRDQYLRDILMKLKEAMTRVGLHITGESH